MRFQSVSWVINLPSNATMLSLHIFSSIARLSNPDSLVFLTRLDAVATRTTAVVTRLSITNRTFLATHTWTLRPGQLVIDLLRYLSGFSRCSASKWPLLPSSRLVSRWCRILLCLRSPSSSRRTRQRHIAPCFITTTRTSSGGSWMSE